MPERIAAGRRTQIHACSHTCRLLRNLAGSVLTVNYQDGRQQDFCDFV